MATFAQWLKDQEPREDPVGWFACYWRDLEGKPRLSAPSSIKDHLTRRGLFESQTGLSEAFDQVVAEFRLQRAQAAQQETAAAVEASVVRHPAGNRLEPLSDPLARIGTQLELVTLALARLCDRLAVPWPGDTPLDWQELYRLADLSATVEEV